MQPQLSVQQWLTIPQGIRYAIARELKLKKSTGRVVDDNVVKSDGHTWEDLQALNVESIQAYLGSSTSNLYELMDELVAKLSPKPIEEAKVDLTAQHLARLKLNAEELHRQATTLGLKTEFNGFLSIMIGVTNNAKTNVQATEKNKGGTPGRKTPKTTR